VTVFETAAREHIASRSEQTKKLYAADLEKWLKVCREHKFDPDEPTKEAATTFRDLYAAGKLTKDPPAKMTQRRVLSALSSMYDAAGIVNRFKSAKYLYRPPADEVAMTQAFTSEECDKMFAAIEADKSLEARRDEVLMRILYETGMRVGTVVKMERKALTRDGEQLIFITTVKKKGRVPVALPKKSAEALEKWLDVAPQSKYVFPAVRGEGPLTRATVNRRLEEYAKSVGVKDAHPHRFRSTYITEALDAGVPLHEVQASVHHSDPATTLRYDRSARGLGVGATVAAFREKRGK
jgi:integrase